MDDEHFVFDCLPLQTTDTNGVVTEENQDGVIGQVALACIAVSTIYSRVPRR